MARTKGSKNRRTRLIEEIASNFELDPFEVLLMVTNGDWKGLGFDGPSKISYSQAGIEFEEPNIKLSERVQAAKEASKYLYSQKQSVALSADTEGFRIVIEDYLTKDKK